jgi:uncharacterized alpha-E superfamily protein
MTRGHAWRFLDMGRRLERATNLLTHAAAVLATDTDGAALPPLLDYTDSTMTYRRRYLASPELPTTFALLLTDDSNPRSLAFQVAALGKHFDDLPGAGDGSPEEHQFAELAALLVETDVFDLTRPGAALRLRFTSRLGELLESCNRLSDLLTASYFSHVTPRVS